MLSGESLQNYANANNLNPDNQLQHHNMISNIANKNEGTAFPTTTITLDHISNFLPSFTALYIPRGIEIK